GVVIVRNVDPGEMVTAGVSSVVDGKPDLAIAQIDKLVLGMDLNQGDGAKVRTGQKCRIDLDAYPGVEAPGTVTQIAASRHTARARGIDVFTRSVAGDPSP